MLFQNIFYFVFSLGFALSDATFILYHTQLSLSSVFWKFLLKYFVHTFLFTLRSFSLSFRSVWISFSLFQDSLNIISYFVCFVKRFFKKLSVFFLRFFGILWKPSGSLNPFFLSFTRLFLRFFLALCESAYLLYDILCCLSTGFAEFFAVCRVAQLHALVFFALMVFCTIGLFFSLCSFAIINLLFLFIRLFCSSFCLYFIV